MTLSVRELVGIRLNAKDPRVTAEFFVTSLGFTRHSSGDGAESLTLGPSRLEIARASGAPYPAAVPAWSPLFQHFAIATHDVGAAYSRLRQTGGWTPISTDGPQRLPPSSGGVTAFKFRSPEGHPLELISAEAGEVPRIDHSAISVTNTEASVAFYDALGLRCGAVSCNHGPEQARLDGLAGAEVDVTGLFAPRGATHLELLAYRAERTGAQTPPALSDVAATRLVFTAVAPAIEALRRRSDLEWSGSSAVLRDPDGHLLQLELERPPGGS